MDTASRLLSILVLVLSPTPSMIEDRLQPFCWPQFPHLSERGLSLISRVPLRLNIPRFSETLRPNSPGQPWYPAAQRVLGPSAPKGRTWSWPLGSADPRGTTEGFFDCLTVHFPTGSAVPLSGLSHSFLHLTFIQCTLCPGLCVDLPRSKGQQTWGGVAARYIFDE